MQNLYLHVVSLSSPGEELVQWMILKCFANKLSTTKQASAGIQRPVASSCMHVGY